MPAKRPELTNLAFKQIAAAPRGKEVELYGLTEQGKVFLFDGNKGYWLPLSMGAPSSKVKISIQTFGDQHADD